jgi:hypothetical protein
MSFSFAYVMISHIFAFEIVSRGRVGKLEGKKGLRLVQAVI